MPFGFITVQYMNNLRDHLVTMFNVLYCNDLNKTIRKLSFFSSIRLIKLMLSLSFRNHVLEHNSQNSYVMQF